MFDPCFGPREPKNRSQEAGRSIFDPETSIFTDLGQFSLMFDDFTQKLTILRCVRPENKKKRDAWARNNGHFIAITTLVGPLVVFFRPIWAVFGPRDPDNRVPRAILHILVVRELQGMIPKRFYEHYENKNIVSSE